MKKMLAIALCMLSFHIASCQEDEKKTTIYEDVKNLYNTVNPTEPKEKTTADQLEEERETEKIKQTPDPAVENARQRQQEQDPNAIKAYRIKE